MEQCRKGRLQVVVPAGCLWSEFALLQVVCVDDRQRDRLQIDSTTGRLACFTPRQRLGALRQRPIVVVLISHEAGG
jgi:hypothetical protein